MASFDENYLGFCNSFDDNHCPYCGGTHYGQTCTEDSQHKEMSDKMGTMSQTFLMSIYLRLELQNIVWGDLLQMSDELLNLHLSPLP